MSTHVVLPTPPGQGVTCYDRIQELSAYDRELSTRREHKAQAAQAAQTSSEFVSLMLDSQEDGEAFSCGLTRSWVTEVFEGLGRQYTEYKYDDGIDGSDAGYEVYIGDDLITFFLSRSYSSRRIIYHVRHTGTEDHVFTIEQLPYARGYRVYQSYADAYSLKAWLSTATAGLFEADTGEIMVWRGLQASASYTLMLLSGGQASLDNLDSLPAELEVARPYFEYVRDYDEEAVMANFEKAWQKYGAGRVLDEAEFFCDYLPKLAKLSVYFSENDHESSPFPQEIWDTWIELFGSPNPLHFPGVPHNFIGDTILTDRNYRLEVLDIGLNANETADRAACASNAAILEDAIVTP
ncbi:hypothetical protein WME73_05800 [Sorangium sp. So ce302]|uniref:hypothetical protein n=1 Tax=Sorangium sp. So ce302 TaxID=3133297 RepID=UPI003F624EEA